MAHLCKPLTMKGTCRTGSHFGWVSEWVASDCEGSLGCKKWGDLNPLAIFPPSIISATHRKTKKVQRRSSLLGRTGRGNGSCMGREKKICLNYSPVSPLQNNSFTLGEGQQTPSSLGYWWNLTVTGGRKQEWETQREGKDYKLDPGLWIQERTRSRKDGPLPQHPGMQYLCKTEASQNNRGHPPPPPSG